MPLTASPLARVGAIEATPSELVVGVGARAGVGAAQLDAAIETALSELDADPRLVRALATVDRRAAEDGIRTVADAHGWLLLAYPAEELSAVPVPTPSARVGALVGTPSVAEAAALLGALALHGSAELVLPKRTTAAVTVAVAGTRGRSPQPGTSDPP